MVLLQLILVLIVSPHIAMVLTEYILEQYVVSLLMHSLCQTASKLLLENAPVQWTALTNLATRKPEMPAAIAVKNPNQPAFNCCPSMLLPDRCMHNRCSKLQCSTSTEINQRNTDQLKNK